MTLRTGGFATLLQVFDMPKSLAFYRDVLGYQVATAVPEDERCNWIMLTPLGSELMLNTAYEAHEPPHQIPPGSCTQRREPFVDCEQQPP